MTTTTPPDPSEGRDPRGRLHAVEEPAAEAQPSAPQRPVRQPTRNLPLALSTFVGREREVAEVGRLIGEEDARLVTLTGPGGSGKTRLALAVAREAAEGFEEGAWWVALAPLSAPELVPQAVAQALVVSEVPGGALGEALVEHLEDKELLLVLDNCEHLIDACAALAERLLHACPNLRILATSREALGISGESSWSVPSLSLPDPRDLPPLEDLVRYEAVGLFLERAKAASGFELTEENAPTVARLCGRLDGIPLAVELAAARTKVLSAGQILGRLEDSLGLLVGRDRTVPTRQRTLRDTLDWSYELLDAQERELFGRLSVFAGGWALEAAEAVGAGGSIQESDVLDLLSGLVDKSLVVAEASPGGEEDALRYRMLEPVRQYGQEWLEESGEAEAVRHRHAAWFLGLAEEAVAKMSGPEQGAWLQRLEREHGNFRAALSWALEPEAAEPEGRLELGLRLAVALGQGGFWNAYGPGEGLRWLERGLAHSSSSGTAPASLRTETLNAAGWLVIWQGDYERAVALLEEGLALSRAQGDKPAMAHSLFLLAEMAMLWGDRARMKALREEAEALRPRLEDRRAIAYLLICLGLAAQEEGDHERVEAWLEESLALMQVRGDKHGASMCLSIMGIAALERGDHERAALLEGELLRMMRAMRDKVGIVYGLMGMAGVTVLQGGPPARAARLWGAEEALREAISFPVSPFDRAHYDYEGYQSAARTRLGDEASWEAAWSEGRAMMPEEAIEYALLADQEEPVPPPPAKEASGLSAREVEVLGLVAQGLTNPQVAHRLNLSPRTVGQHLRSIYNKLGVPSRAAAVKEAVGRGLL